MRTYLAGQRRLVDRSMAAPCIVEGCSGIAKRRPATNYCHKHEHQAYRTGDPTMRTPKDRDLARHRDAIERTLRLHHGEPAIAWAVATVEREIFGYVSLQGFSYQLWAQHRFNMLRDKGCKPMQLLQRLLECYALRRDDGGYIFKTPKTWQAFLARKVLRIKDGCLQANVNAYQLAHCGGILDAALGTFATATLIRMDRDEAEWVQFKAACEQLAGSP